MILFVSIFFVIHLVKSLSNLLAVPLCAWAQSFSFRAGLQDRQFAKPTPHFTQNSVLLFLVVLLVFPFSAINIFIFLLVWWVTGASLFFNRPVSYCNQFRFFWQRLLFRGGRESERVKIADVLWSLPLRCVSHTPELIGRAQLAIHGIIWQTFVQTCWSQLNVIWIRSKFWNSLIRTWTFYLVYGSNLRAFILSWCKCTVFRTLFIHVTNCASLESIRIVASRKPCRSCKLLMRLNWEYFA